jgi:O-antigen chain-terminating methyltransferase
MSARENGRALHQEVRRLTARVAELERRLDENVFPEVLDYFDFEQRFRGSPEEIARRQTMYLDIFEGRQGVLDLGCGRGEFVDLLVRHDIGVLGVDASSAMVEFGASRGLPVVHADLFEHLEHQADASLGGVAALQVVEHLLPDGIIGLLIRAAKKLSPLAPMLAETVNPACLRAMGNFFVDPTHVRPVPAPLLVYLFERAGLCVSEVRYSAPIEATDEMASVLHADPHNLPDTSDYQDYAVVGCRPGSR